MKSLKRSMLVYSILFLAVSLSSMTGYAQIVAWGVSGLGGYGPSPYTPTSSNGNLTIGGLTRGPGVGTGGTAAGSAWGGVGFTSASASASVSAGKYVTFTVSANTGYNVSFSSLNLNYRRSSTGAPSGELQYSIDGGAYSTLAALSFSSSASGGASHPAVSLSSVNALQHVKAGSVITFRIVPYAGSGATGTWYVFGAGLSVNGSVNTPSVIAGTVPGFGNVCLNSDKEPSSFTITGTNLSNGVPVTVGALSGYTYATTPEGPFTSTLSFPQTGGAFSRQVYVKFSPAAVQSYDGNIAVSGGGISATVNVAVTGSGVDVPASNASSNSPLCEGMELVLDGTASTGNGTLTYSWSGPGSFVATGETASVTATPGHAGEYTLLITDENNCTASQTIEVTVEKVISAPANISVEAEAGNCSVASIDLGQPSLSENCTATTVVNDAPASFPAGTTVVTWTATVGVNVYTATQTVTVKELEPPVITAPEAITVSADPGECTASAVVLGTPVTSDNCTVATVVNDAPASFPAGITVVTWTVTDASGNTATATQEVTVNDEELPVITAPSALSINVDAGECTANAVAFGTPVTSDNCSVSTVVNDAPASFPVGTTIVTWTVTDASGNMATATQEVIVSDEELPVITAPSALSVDAGAGTCLASGVELGTPVTSDNCTVATVTNDAPEVFNAGTTTVTWTVTDASGNSATATQEVTVNTSIEPQINIVGASEVCEGTLVTFTASVQGVGNAPVYQWKLNGNDVGGNEATYAVDTLEASDVVSCVLTTDLTCAVTPEANSNEITISEVKTSPVVLVTSAPAALLICTGTQVTFTATGADSYSWTDGVINGQPFTPSSSGEYSVTGTNANGCSHTMKVEVELQNCTDVRNALDGNKNVSIYPNPSNGAFEIEFDSALERDIVIMDLQGKVLYKTQENGMKTSVDMRGIGKGIYVVSTGTGAGKTIHMVAVE